MSEEAPAVVAEAPAEAPAEVTETVEAPITQEAPKPTWKAADKPAFWKFPPKTNLKLDGKVEIDAETKLSKDQLKILKESFKIFDSEHKNAITLDVIKIILELFTGEPVDQEALEEVMDEYDEDESGEIEFAEFIKLASHFVEPEEDYEKVKAQLREIFILYDKEEKGHIPVADFKLILKELDPDVSNNDLDEMVKEIDTDASGTIEFEEFVEVMIGEDEDDNKRKKRD